MPPAMGRAAKHQTKTLRIPSILTLNVSSDVASTILLGNFFSVTVCKNHFLTSKLSLPFLNLKPFRIVLVLSDHLIITVGLGISSSDGNPGAEKGFCSSQNHGSQEST